MTEIARYIAAASFAQTGTATGTEAVKASASECPECNYTNNYYGDQVCLKRQK